MKWEKILNSRFGTSLPLVIASVLPLRTGRWLARRAGRWIGRQKRMRIVKTVKANQWVVSGGRFSKEELRRRVVDVFESRALSLFDFYHLLNRCESVLELIDFDESFERLLQQNQQAKIGQLMVCPHITNFDLLGRAMGLRGMRLQILSYPNPPGGYQLQNKLREVKEMVITPLSIQALRQASDTLSNGGAVITGVDRPIEDKKYCPVFFGRPAALPVGHVRLALKLKLPVIVVAGCRTPQGRYQLWASDPIPMRPDNDLQKEITRNAEAILEVVEEYIRWAPEQWAMFYPVWPEVLAEQA
jgi:KDO2-lipid IV(A) lauroyltransferase